MTYTVGILYPGHSAEDDYPVIQRTLGDGVRLPLVHTRMNEHAHRVDELLCDDDVSAWRRKCIRLALREPGSVIRDPYNRLNPEWIQVDPDLEPLHRAAELSGWARFVGVKLDTGSQGC